MARQWHWSHDAGTSKSPSIFSASNRVPIRRIPEVHSVGIGSRGFKTPRFAWEAGIGRPSGNSDLSEFDPSRFGIGHPVAWVRYRQWQLLGTRTPSRARQRDQAGIRKWNRQGIAGSKPREPGPGHEASRPPGADASLKAVRPQSHCCFVVFARYPNRVKESINCILRYGKRRRRVNPLSRWASPESHNRRAALKPGAEPRSGLLRGDPALRSVVSLDLVRSCTIR